MSAYDVSLIYTFIALVQQNSNHTGVEYQQI